MRAAASWALAVLLGLALASLPFVHFGAGHASHDAAHAVASHAH